MGLTVVVGMLAQCGDEDADFLQSINEDMDRLNAFLDSVGLPRHCEPTVYDSVSYQMYGYSGLHYLRRIAAHLNLNGALPPPGDANASKDEVIEAYNSLLQPPGFFQKWFGKTRAKRRFDHLMFHGDAEGYYLPLDFQEVLFAPESSGIPGLMIGSAPRLLAECDELAGKLGLPLDLDPDDEEIWSALDSQGQGTVSWRRYGVESFGCIRLHAACRHCLKTGAAIVFC